MLRLNAMTKALFAGKQRVIIKAQRPFPKGWPSFYMMKTSIGWGLYAAEGERKGAACGHFFDNFDGTGELEIYEEFHEKGGLSWDGRKTRHVVRGG